MATKFIYIYVFCNEFIPSTVDVMKPKDKLHFSVYYFFFFACIALGA